MGLNNALGKELKALRERKGVTIEQLCSEIEQRYCYSLSKGKYSEMERGIDKDFGYTAVRYLAIYFGVSADFLLNINACIDFIKMEDLIADINTAEIASHLNDMDEWTGRWRSEARSTLYEICYEICESYIKE